MMSVGVHWIYLFNGFLYYIGLTALGVLLDNYAVPYGSEHYIRMEMWLHYKFGIPQELGVKHLLMAIGAILFLLRLKFYLTTRILVNEKTFVIKKYWIMVKVIELQMEEIKAIHVYEGFLGRLLGYGSLFLDSRFVKDLHIPFIHHPYEVMALICENSRKAGESFDVLKDA